MTKDKLGSKRPAAPRRKVRSLVRPPKRNIKLKTRRRHVSADSAIAVMRTASEYAGSTLWTGVASDDAD